MSSWPEIQRAGWLPDSFRGCPTIPIWDLETVVELLEGPCQVLHYLTRRGEVESLVRYAGDELDLLGFYLETGFNHPVIHAGDNLTLTGMQKVVDRWMLREDLAFEVEKPTLRLTPWWQRLIERIQRLSISRWTELGYYLLNVEFPDQRRMEQAFRAIQRAVRRRVVNPHGRNTVVLAAGSGEQRVGLALMAYKNVDRTERNRLMTNAAGHAAELSGTNKVVVVARNVMRDEDPYSAVALIELGSVPESGQ